MDGLESFAIGWSSASLLDCLKEERELDGKPFVSHVMRIFEIFDRNGFPIVVYLDDFRNLEPAERGRRLESYKTSLKNISSKVPLDENSRTQLTSFLKSVSDYCITESRRSVNF